MKRKYDPTIEQQAKMFPDFDIKDAPASRETLSRFLESLAEMGVERQTDDRIEEIERTIPGPDGAPDLPIRIYMPKDRTEPGPVFVNFHGGGWLFGGLDMEHGRSLAIAAGANAVAVTVDYRLAPENPFPAALEDCYATLEWVIKNAGELKVDPSKVVIGGGSAGGNLTAAVALMARDRNGPDIALQMIIYPALDDQCQSSSMTSATDTLVWNYQNTIDAWNNYIGQDRSNVSPYAAPLRATDLSGLPPAYIMTAEHDPLRDEGIEYALRLMKAGVQVELHNYPGTVHIFDFYTPSEISTTAAQEQITAFKRAVADEAPAPDWG